MQKYENICSLVFDSTRILDVLALCPTSSFRRRYGGHQQSAHRGERHPSVSQQSQQPAP